MRPWRLKTTDALLKGTDGLSFADVRAAIEDAYKDAILGDQKRPTHENIAARLQERQARVPKP
jgi:hypothetical protein